METSSREVGGVLHHVVQQRRHHAVGVHPQLPEEGGHLYRVGDIGLARAALLLAVGIVGQLIGAVDDRQVVLVAGGQLLAQLFVA